VEKRAYFPSLTGISDNAVLLVIPELKGDLRPILETKENVKYSFRWYFDRQNKKLVLQIDWSTGSQTNIVLSEDQQKALIPEILDKGHIGLMFDYDPDAKKKTSGVLIISNVDKGLKEIAEQL